MYNTSKNYPKTPSELCNVFFDCENTHKTLDKQYHNAPLWAYVRTAIYYKLSEYSGFFSSHHSTSVGLKKIFCLIKVQLETFLFFNPLILKFSKKVDCIVFEHPRAREINKSKVDIYSHFLIEHLKQDGKKILLFDKGNLGKHEKSPRKGRFYLDNIEALQRLAYKLGSLFGGEAKFFGNELEYFVSKIEGADNIISKELNGSYYHFIIGKWFVKLILKWTNPDVVYLVDAYSKRHFITVAAKELNISVVELQHGIISNYHLGYAFPEARKNSYNFLPDTFRGWGKEWSKAENAWYNTSYINSSFEYLYFLKDNYPLLSLKERSRNIVIISQGALGDELSSEIAKRVSKFNNFNVYYKLHPGEYSSYKDLSGYKVLSQQPNFSFITDDDLYYLFSISHYVVGVFSTAILEALAFGLEPYLVDISGIEYMEGRLDFKLIDELF
jgi:hypothetical protein